MLGIFKKVLCCLLLCIALGSAACGNIAEQTQIETTAASESTAVETTIAETTVAEEQTRQEQSSDEEALAAAEAQKKLDVIKQFTLEMTEDEAEFYWDNAFLQLYMAPMMHWEPMFFFPEWEDSFPVYELDLEYDDPTYGTVELRFVGSLIHEIMMSDIYFCNYPSCTITEKNGTEHFMKKSAIEDQEIYVVGTCEGLPFGMPADGGTGPYWAIKVVDGKAEVISRNVVMLKAPLPNAEDLPAIDYRGDEK